MTDTHHDHHFDERLRRLGRALDDATPPVSPDEARSRAAGRRRPRWVAPSLAAAACVVVAGIAGLTLAQRTDDTSVVAGPPSRPGSNTTTPSTAVVPTTTPSTTVVPTTTAPASTAPLPGERIEIYPYAGARLAVVGVAADDTLNVRAGPSTDYPVAFTLEPLADDIRATGHNRIGEGAWAEIDVGGRTGWASIAFLLQPGLVDDVTARWYPSPSDRPSATTMTALAQAVERSWRQEGIGSGGSEEPDPRAGVVVDGPRGGDLSEVTIDVLGIPDDAGGGVRLHIFAERAAGRFTLRTVELTELCRRGVTDGMCT